MLTQRVTTVNIWIAAKGSCFSGYTWKESKALQQKKMWIQRATQLSYAIWIMIHLQNRDQKTLINDLSMIHKALVTIQTISIILLYVFTITLQCGHNKISFDRQPGEWLAKAMNSDLDSKCNAPDSLLCPPTPISSIKHFAKEKPAGISSSRILKQTSGCSLRSC